MCLVNPGNCEAIVFGKGIGESVLIRLSEKEWIIIDSCLNNDKRPAALEYLKSIGVNVAVDVKLIIISHFHDDHISGLNQTLEACQNTKLVISAALNTSDFKEYINGLSKSGENMAKTKEITKIMSHLPSLVEQNKIIYAKKDCILYRSANGVEVHALSPNDRDIALSDLDFINHLKIANNISDVAFSARKINPNHYCIVIRISSSNSGNNEILLGADLEVKKHSGWDSVCDALNSPTPRKAGFFKIPHHGSENGFHQRTWDQLLRDKPLSVMTTYDSSKLPRQEMITLYKNKSLALYCTSEPKSLTPRDLTRNENASTSRGKAQSILSKMETSVSFSGIASRFGYITISDAMTSTPIVSIHEGAVCL